MTARVTRSTELRHMPAASLSIIANILEINEDWKKFVPLIPKSPHSQERKYNCEEIQTMEDTAKERKQKYADVLFDEWGTSGRERPTLGTLMNLLQEAQIIRAVEEIARMLGEPPPPRPINGPGASITTNLSAILNDMSIEQKLDSMETIPTDNLQNSSHDNILCAKTTKRIEEENLIEFSTSGSIKLTPPWNISYQGNEQNMHSLSHQQNEENFPSTSQYRPALTDMLETPYENQQSSSSVAESSSTNNTVSDMTYGSSSQNESTCSQFTPVVCNVQYSTDIFGIIDMAIVEDKNLLPFQYKELETITERFSDTFKPDVPVGKIGSGGFGDVYVGVHRTHGALAVKKVRTWYQIGSDLNTIMKIFNTEVKSLSHLRHENIVPIFGYSIDGPSPCLVCKYIDGGSLLQKIEAKVLTQQQRINIMIGTASGLHYIHHCERPQATGEVLDETEEQLKKSYYLHGDIKSANILLTKNCVPMLCDFGLTKQLNTTIHTRAMMGTSAYMSPEGLSGTITQKNDIYSFGIVFLELLTGLPPIIAEGSDQINIKVYVEEMCPDGVITSLLDRSVPKWTKAQDIYNLANKCLNMNKINRPTIDEVCKTLNDINKAIR